MSDAEREAGRQPMIKFDEHGLVPAIVQDADTGAVLMMAWMNEAALAATLANGKATFYSRSRKKMWVKGESSGHIQQVIEARVDCDQDAVLLRVRSHGPACHAGFSTCFYRAFNGGSELKFVESKTFDPDAVYHKA
jgi:phosphoribosyl-AMP cyclohydrolase